ncbi:ribosome biogenesis GTPase YqeH [Pediococcus pentosaceus]|jgi:ribosome biogenesis GTPase YqeH|uniref:ribosome biogenesis GTPase YqeH n=1 Tax=Pediococcus pentosaceus TaxID=1255 RepID=UPI00191AB000|nr:ribosome biogenesis GTPase YqeH [Pediococcus pentosaceus]MCH3989135.1 ribosome biogenesis GTPase YqeH [Pediococcus pentosaceus]MCH4015381.1 ribosome biogenesis GTPase YqeH [Pediococcus pentosaceus]MCI1396891.1 ribosome biogenesis GTPase YqeH [Pediococcus pentosaceus]MCI1471695.1 ribosome biogenesis GTPase YqeH [Pediococcus pentosaceus]MCQ0027926.1 ribosome biogenesis GTPase YqeH [Pediococcus pentosaceus]
MDEQNELRCIGCGAILQVIDKKTPGYTPESALKKGLESGQLYCQRCFRLRHYNEIAPVDISDDDFRKLLSQISDSNSLVVYVVDMFDFNGSLIPGLHRFIGDNPVLLVGNKEDVFPKSIKRHRMKEWLRQQAKANGILPEDVVITSAKNASSVEALFNAVEKLRKGRDVYVVGVTNVGKSTLINSLIAIRNGIKDVITTSRFPGTTLDRIEIPFDDHSNLIDTPGIIHADQMAHVLAAEDLKYVSPQKTIKPRVFQLNSQQTLFVGALARFDYEHSEGSVTAYFDNNLMVHRTKLENADNFYEKHAGELLTPPTADNLAKMPKLVAHQFSADQDSDIVFEGLGWISVPEGSTITAWAPEGISVVIRRSLI